MASEGPGRWARGGAVFRRRWVLVTLGVLVVLFAAYTLAGFFLVPPRVDAVMCPDGRMNIADLLDAFPKGEPAKQRSAPPRLLVQHAVVQHGLVSFTDQSRRATQQAGVQPIDIELHDITTLPEHRGP